MNVKHTLPLLILVSLFSQAFGQEEVKYIKRYHKQKAWFSIQFDYSHHNVNFVEDIRGDIAFAKAPGVFRHSSIGVALRIPVWRFIYVQPEVLYGLSTNWEEAAVQTGFFSQMAYAFKNRTASILQVPFHIGCRWEPADLFAARAYIAPVFDFVISDGTFQSTLPRYSLSAGVGLDLLGFLLVDVGYRKGMNRMQFRPDSDFFFASVGLRL